MSFFERASRGWDIVRMSFTVLQANPRLLLFPLFSGISLALIFGAAAAAWYGNYGMTDLLADDRLLMYGIAFLAYLVNYIVVIFFNMALMRCAKMYFDGEEVDIAAGLRFSVSRLPVILSWAFFAATIGTLLKALQDNLGWFGKIIGGLLGIAWGVSTFFVVPVLAYENVGPVRALKRSAGLMRERWGERLTAGFSFAVINLVAVILIVILAAMASVAHEGLSIAVVVLGIAGVVTVMSAVNSIFVSAVYSGMSGSLETHFNEKLLQGLFVEK